MPRIIRPAQYPGAIFHVTNRGNARCPIVRDDRDYEVLLDSLARIKKRSPFELIAHCMMPNHFHLLIRLLDANLSNILQRFTISVTRRFHDRWGTTGHLFQGRFWAGACENEAYFLEVIRYIHLNAVRGGLVKEPGDWPHSSHLDYCGTRVTPLTDARIGLELFGAGGAGLRQYLDFMGAGLRGEGLEFEPVLEPLDEEFKFEERLDPAPPKRALIEVARESCAASGTAVGEVRGPGRARPVMSTRRAFVLQAIQEGHRPTDIAAFLGRTCQAIANLTYRPSRKVRR